MSAEQRIGERHIRDALLRKCLVRQVQCPDTLVIHELGLVHAKKRVDLAVVDDAIHGFEIKSSLDNLDRLPSQIEVYRQSLQKLTLVAASKHIHEVMEITPWWCGVMEVLHGASGGINFQSLRLATLNPDVDEFFLAHLLWRNEAQRALIDKGIKGVALRGPRRELYRTLVAMVSEFELAAIIKSFMAQRPDWRGCLPPQ